METKEISKNEYLQLLNGRKYLYHLLYVLFSKPLTLETYKEIQDGFHTEELSKLFEEGKNLFDYFNSENIEESIKLAREDYFQLFIGPNSLLAPPWESVYRGHDNTLFDFPTFEVRELYKQFNLGIEQIKNQHVEADDHIKYELEFMVVLIKRSLEEKKPNSLKQLISGQSIMLNEHLAKWIPQFSKDIQNHAKTAYFISAAQLLESFIELDITLIDELINLHA